MEFATLISATIYGAVLIATPGPAVISLFHSGINYGFKKTLPYFSGILIGYLINQIISAFVLFSALQISPILNEVAKIASLLYIAFLSYKIITSTVIKTNQVNNPLKFHHGLLLNLINPKAYIISFSAFSQFVNPQQLVYSVATIIALYISLDIILQGSWILFGNKISHILESYRRRLVINTLLVICIWAALLLPYLTIFTSIE